MKPQWRVAVVDLALGDVSALRVALSHHRKAAHEAGAYVLDTPSRAYTLTAEPLSRDNGSLLFARFDAVLVAGVADAMPRSIVAPWVHHVVGDRVVGFVGSASDAQEMSLRKTFCDVGIAGDDLTVVQGRPADEDAVQAIADALDALPETAPDEETSLRMYVDDAFVIRGRGVVLAGQIRRGTLRVGDEVDLLGGERTGPCRIGGIEMIRRLRDSVRAPDVCAVLVSGLERDAYRPATILARTGSAKTTREVRVRITQLPEVAARWELAFQCHLRGQIVEVACIAGPESVTLRFAWAVWCEPGERVLLSQDRRWVATGEVFERVESPP